MQQEADSRHASCAACHNEDGDACPKHADCEIDNHQQLGRHIVCQTPCDAALRVGFAQKMQTLLRRSLACCGASCARTRPPLAGAFTGYALQECAWFAPLLHVLAWAVHASGVSWMLPAACMGVSGPGACCMALLASCMASCTVCVLHGCIYICILWFCTLLPVS